MQEHGRVCPGVQGSLTIECVKALCYVGRAVPVVLSTVLSTSRQLCIHAVAPYPQFFPYFY